MDTIEYLSSLKSIRDRCSKLIKNPECLQHFNLNLDKLDSCASMVVDLIKRDYKSIKDIPPHSRWRHFDAGASRITPLLNSWEINQREKVRRLLDLFVVGVLLDAGAGDKWKFNEIAENKVYNRSEGLAIAALYFFVEGGCSSVPEVPQADSEGLKAITVNTLASAFQVTGENPLVGLEGRCALLQRLGDVVTQHEYFASVDGGHYRPGNILDYLLSHPNTTHSASGEHVVPISTLWTIVMKGFSGVWPEGRSKLNGVSLGDVWPCKALEKISGNSDVSASLLPFHKLSQWLTYSLMEPLSLAGIIFSGTESMTGLAEYRNGGFFVDMDVLTLKNPADSGPFLPQSDVIVEWRGLTIALLDLVADKVRDKLGVGKDVLPLPKILEAGTWKAGREIAALKRPDTKGPPIQITSDGTIF